MVNSTEEIALDHKTRRMIHNYIHEHPGVRFPRLKHVFDLATGTLRYHLGYLVKAEMINVRTENGKKCYYLEQVASTRLEDEHRLKNTVTNNTQNHILKVIKNDPGITKKKIVKKTGIKKPTVTYALKKLQEQKVIWKVGGGRNTGYEYITSKELNNEIFKLLLEKFANGEIDEKKFLALKERLERD